MKLQDVSPILRTKDLQASVDFYTDILGFQLDALCEEWNWARVKRDGVAVMFTRPGSADRDQFDRPLFTGSLYFYPDDVNAAWEQLKDRVNVCYPIEDIRYGMREFGIYDNNGYLLQFGQEMSHETNTEQERNE